MCGDTVAGSPFQALVVGRRGLVACLLMDRLGLKAGIWKPPATDRYTARGQGSWGPGTHRGVGEQGEEGRGDVGVGRSGLADAPSSSGSRI